MRGKKIIIISIIINIITIGIIYNFIKKDYLNNEKIIVKALTEGEYEDNITSLNQSHINYANYIEESKTKIASAITDMGVTTSNEATLETMANNIKSIARDASSISYNNTNSGLTATNVQGAVDELNDSLEWKLLHDTGVISDQREVPLPDDWKEVKVRVLIPWTDQNNPQRHFTSPIVSRSTCKNMKKIADVTEADYTTTDFMNYVIQETFGYWWYATTPQIAFGGNFVFTCFSDVLRLEGSYYIPTGSDQVKSPYRAQVYYR